MVFRSTVGFATMKGWETRKHGPNSTKPEIPEHG